MINWTIFVIFNYYSFQMKKTAGFSKKQIHLYERKKKLTICMSKVTAKTMTNTTITQINLYRTSVNPYTTRNSSSSTHQPNEISGNYTHHLSLLQPPNRRVSPTPSPPSHVHTSTHLITYTHKYIYTLDSSTPYKKK